MQRELSGVSGVKEVSIDYNAKIAVVRGNQDLEPQTLIKVLEDTNRYHAVIIDP